MSDEPDATPEEEPVADDEVQAPKTGAEAWRERRQQIIQRGAAAAREGGKAPSGKAKNQVVDGRRLNADREAAQQRSKNTGRTQRRSRG